jgi:hypothetical protein
MPEDVARSEMVALVADGHQWSRTADGAHRVWGARRGRLAISSTYYWNTPVCA